MQGERENKTSDEIMKYLPKWQQWLWKILKEIKNKNVRKCLTGQERMALTI